MTVRTQVAAVLPTRDGIGAVGMIPLIDHEGVEVP